MKSAPTIALTAEERQVLETWARGRSTPVRLMERARIVLAAAQGTLNKDLSRLLGMPPNKIGRWRRRFAAARLEGIRKDRPRGARKPDAELTRRILESTTRTTPPGRTHWGSRGLAQHLGTSPSTVQRVWRAAGLKPHLTRTFKLSNDPRFAEKLLDVVGLYLHPPEHALVLCVDEKSQIQALDRTQPSLPMYQGRGRTLTHDYKRNGTTTLFAALNVANGQVIGNCLPRHRHQEYLRFLKQIDRATPPDQELHLIVDNYATHKHPRVLRWLARHRRFHIHFTPTSSSWLNLVERWFRELTENRIRRDSFRSVDQLVAAIEEYLTLHNQSPKPFVWVAQAEAILAKVERARRALENVKQTDALH
jgi:transposase